jgi:hypothetical protein
MPIVFILCLSLLSWSQPFEQPAETTVEVADVHISVLTAFGDALAKPTVVLREVGPRTEYRKVGDDQGGIDLPGVGFGLYDLEVSAKGFAVLHERIGIYQSDFRLSVGLFVSQIHGSQRSEITGSVTMGGANTEDLWIRLLPMYSADFIEGHVRSNGTFQLGGLHPGRFVVLVFHKKELVSTKILDYDGGRIIVNLSVPSR